MSSPQRNQLIDAAVAALGALVDLRRLGHDEAVRLATEFLLFKLHAAFDSGERIRQQIPAAMSSVKQIPLGGTRVGGTFEIDPEARFMLYLLVDSFLFEAGSIRDALAQVANAVFGLGVPVDEVDLGNRIVRKLQATATTTGLEAWFQKDAHPGWLVTLLLLRNTTTHRHVVRLSTRYQVTDFRPAGWADWPSTARNAGFGKR